MVSMPQQVHKKDTPPKDSYTYEIHFAYNS